MPVYNAKLYLERCLNALVKQTLDNYEIICVDDGSTDGSGVILEQYQADYPEILRVFHEKNAGSWFARMKGIEKAEGEYIGFCDSDDFVEEDMFFSMYQEIISSGADMAVCAYWRVDEKTGKILSKEMCGFGNRCYTMAEMGADASLINVAFWNKLIRADLIKRHIILENPPAMMEDTIMQADLLFRLNKIIFIDRPCYHYYAKESSAVSNITQEEAQKIKDNILKLKQIPVETKEQEELLLLIVFIHMGISLPLRWGKGYLSKTIKVTKDILQYLDSEFVGWRKLSLLKTRYVFLKNRKLMKPWIAKMAYDIHVFPLFLCAYAFIIRHCNIDIKW